MSSAWNNMTPGKRLAALGLLALVLGGAVLWSYGGALARGLPFPSVIRAEKSKIRKLKRRIRAIRKQQRKYQARLREVRALAAPFRHLGGGLSAADVSTEFGKLTRRAQVSPQSVRLLRERPDKFSDYVLSVELAILLRTSMREISRLLAELEKARGGFYWRTCSIRPDNPRAPRQVYLSGRLQTLFLSPDAERLLFANSAAAKERAP